VLFNPFALIGMSLTTVYCHLTDLGANQVGNSDDKKGVFSEKLLYIQEKITAISMRFILLFTMQFTVLFDFFSLKREPVSLRPPFLYTKKDFPIYRRNIIQGVRKVIKPIPSYIDDCPHCKQPTDYHDVYCKHCGRKVE
jgi:hypothetical protein